MHPKLDILIHHYKDTIFNHFCSYNKQNSDLNLMYHYVQQLNINHIKYFLAFDNNLISLNPLWDNQPYSLSFHKRYHIKIFLDARLENWAISIFVWISYNLYLINIKGIST